MARGRRNRSARLGVLGVVACPVPLTRELRWGALWYRDASRARALALGRPSHPLVERAVGVAEREDILQGVVAVVLLRT